MTSREVVAQKARETFLAIRKLRKMMPRFTRAQKDELQAKTKELQDQWWDGVKDLMIRPCPGTDSDYWKK